MSVAEFDADLVVDARDCILGRVASQVAERALDGERVAVVNAERAVVTGRKNDVFERYEKRTELGSDRGPYYPKRPDRIFKRSIRGMLPHKTDRGREAFENVRVYVGNPYEGDDDRATEVLDGTSLDRLSNIRFVTLGEVSEYLGANKTW
jgi:large subunit ribosomal protein L13